MTSSEKIRPQDNNPRDEFNQIIRNLGALGDTLNFHERGEYGEVDVSSEMRCMREAFESHVKAAHEISPEVPLTDEDYRYISFKLNKTDVLSLDEIVPGCTICVGEGAFTAYGTESGTAFENIADDERISGQLVYFMVMPMPPLTAFLDEAAQLDSESEMNYELGVLIKSPVLEDEFGSRRLPYAEMLVSVSDPGVSYTVRLDTTVQTERTHRGEGS
jgi:hypothetical protein